MVQNVISWYKRYRDILNSDIIHLCRADGRDWDGIMHVNPDLKEKAFVLVYNPLNEPVEKQTFFYDNLMAYASFMEHLSRTLYHYTYPYKHQDDKTALIDNLDIAYSEMEAARDALYASQHGVFATWYETDRLLGLKTTLEIIDKTRIEAAKGA